MKLVKTIAAIGALMVSLNAYPQGEVTFANSSTQNIINSLTGSAATAGLLRVGLYYTADLEARPLIDARVADDVLTLVGTTANVLTGGIFLGGFKILPDVPSGASALMQVRAWSAAFATYEEAYTAGLTDTSVLVGNSIVMEFPLGGGTNPRPGLIVEGGLQQFSVAPVPEPSMIALSLLGGLGAMVLLRRRK